ncbi:MAG: hypothetical protein HLUCCO07_04760 [Rhodobacteraceae bacterium HLUCCO07]|nr:MAG: hypothetical protein HLUCCO07_04760 [Rhodobacteraceae bacterium HLUCCO07]
MNDLDARMCAAHEAGDGAALIALYTEAALIAASDTARGFYLTHAFVHALEAGDARANDLRAELHAMGRI